MPKSPQVAFLIVEEKQLYSEQLLDDRASDPVPKGELRHPEKRLISATCTQHLVFWIIESEEIIVKGLKPEMDSLRPILGPISDY